MKVKRMHNKIIEILKKEKNPFNEGKLTFGIFLTILFHKLLFLKYIIYNSTIEILVTPAFLALSINFTTYSCEESPSA